MIPGMVTLLLVTCPVLLRCTSFLQLQAQKQLNSQHMDQRKW